MSDVVIKVENLSKLYRLGVWGTGTLKDDIMRKVARWRGKEDPTRLVGSTNKLDTIDGDEVWALKDINFEVRQGEVLGIIGKNGAGKSTLLKILSEITGPSQGSIKMKGRVASLLEVGTGMHPELTGRENIYLNGALLGMKKWEIQAKFDEIVDFAGIAKYLDTAIKRYSSGMRVRLGFAIAAFLEPEILIVDEVLAVGDAEFQKKAIGKMKDISRGNGRTVLFVSHNMMSIQQLCSRTILLGEGSIHYDGNTDNAIDKYNNRNLNNLNNSTIFENDFFAIINCEVMQPESKIENLVVTKNTIITFKVMFKQNVIKPSFGFHLFTSDDVPVFSTVSWEESRSSDSKVEILDEIKNNSLYDISFEIPAFYLNEISYYLNFVVMDYDRKILSFVERCLILDFIQSNSMRGNYFGKWLGVVRPSLKWNVNEVY